jgi:hypothetical protein
MRHFEIMLGQTLNHFCVQSSHCMQHLILLNYLRSVCLSVCVCLPLITRKPTAFLLLSVLGLLQVLSYGSELSFTNTIGSVVVATYCKECVQISSLQNFQHGAACLTASEFYILGLSPLKNSHKK